MIFQERLIDDCDTVVLKARCRARNVTGNKRAPVEDGLFKVKTPIKEFEDKLLFSACVRVVD